VRRAAYIRIVPAAARAVVWAARLAWLVVAVAGGSAVGEALSDRSRAVQVVGTTAAWAGWAIGAGALAVLSVVTLTVARTVVPGSIVVALVVIIDGVELETAIGLLAPALIASALVATAEFGSPYIQASAYGDELRFGLRPPIGYLTACVATWLLTATAIVVAPTALAGRAWVLGITCAVVALGGLAVLPRRWHQLSRRWLVLVPAGVVVHDPVVLIETLMLPRRMIAGIVLDDLGNAREKSADLTGPTPGLGVEIALAEPAAAVLAPTTGARDGMTIHAAAVVVAPTRPGAAVRAAIAAGYSTV
jgi:hypothetical protein